MSNKCTNKCVGIITPNAALSLEEVGPNPNPKARKYTKIENRPNNDCHWHVFTLQIAH